MDKIYDLARRARNVLGCRPNIQRRTRKMDPIVRRALATTLNTTEVEEELKQLQSELQEAQKQYEQSLAKEVFIGQRIAKYRAVLDEQAAQLKQERPLDDNDDEDWNVRMQKWERDHDALQNIMDQHKDLIANCETIRRRIEEMRERQTQLEDQQQEVDDFKVAAATDETRQEEEETTQLLEATTNPDAENAANDSLSATLTTNDRCLEEGRSGESDERAREDASVSLVDAGVA